jgi:hypothetical protein
MPDAQAVQDAPQRQAGEESGQEDKDGDEAREDDELDRAVLDFALGEDTRGVFAAVVGSGEEADDMADAELDEREERRGMRWAACGSVRGWPAQGRAPCRT